MNGFGVLLLSAATIGVVHTALGFDHSVTFVALSRARRWSLHETLSVTALSGLLHVASSVLIAAGGLLVGVAVKQIDWIESSRGAFAAWLLVAFGATYALLALVQGMRARSKSAERSAAVEGVIGDRPLMPLLVAIFALGPCEALLPLLTTGGVLLDVWDTALVAFVFSLATIVTMLALVILGYRGTEVAARRFAFLSRFGPHAHVLAGATLVISGLAIRVLGI